MKKSILPLFLFLLIFVPISAKAFTVKSANYLTIPKEETINDNLYTASQDLTIEGKVNGDLVCVGSNLTINGEVTGDVICVAETITINGKVDGSARIAGKNITINGSVGRNVNTASSEFSLGDKAEISKDLLIVSNSAIIRGKIGTDFHGILQKSLIAGSIGRNVFLRFNEMSNDSETPITIEKTAVINGSLNYTSDVTGSILSGANIQGGINHSLPNQKNQNEWKTLFAWGNLFSIFSALIIGLVLTSLWSKKTKDIIVSMQQKPGLSILIGFLIMLLAPIISIFLLFTIIGIPLSLIILGTWLITAYVSKVLVAIMIGQKFLKKIKPEKKISLHWTMIIGIVLSWTIFSIPVIGWSLGMIAGWWGLGTIFLILKEESHEI